MTGVQTCALPISQKKPTKRRLDQRLVSEGLADTIEVAQKEILAGLVRVGGECVDKAGALVADDRAVSVEGRRMHVGRGALKMEAAFKAFPISCAGLVCADVGACTGGFTEILLRNGAAKVYAIDVGYGNLDWKIRSDSRVVVMERTNARHVKELPEKISFATIDVSFISLKKILPAVESWLDPGATVIALVKPQFEAAREEIEEGGIVRNPDVHARVVAEIRDALPESGLLFRGVEESPILGGDGNREFLMWASK